ncbi:MAG: hypothetical protein B6U89_03060 [Desulfurococcales archaeon ex4484_58]|nr:MAG: hypothetical protein B6U89_03060 [Desulfurococcales archaeon ex4484_58]
MINLEKLRNKLVVFLENARWWPSSNREFEIVDVFRGCKGILLVLESNNQLYQLPLSPVENVPEDILKEKRFLEYDGKKWIESEYTIYYMDLMDSLEVIEKETYREIRGRVVEASPIALGTTNVVAKHKLDSGLEIVVKSYRLLPINNSEPLIITKLHSSSFKYIPKLYYSYILRLDKKIHSSFIMDYIRGVGDGGKPFSDSFKGYLEKAKGKNKSLLKSSYRLRLARKLGLIIADMHVKLNPGLSSGFFGLEEISNSDVSLWIKRIENRYKWIINRLDQLILDSSGREKNRYEFWRSVITGKKFRKILDKVKHDLDKYYMGAYKGRIHQDLHLQQMIYVPENEVFIITDFEGEPGRSDKERIVKEPLVRDLATMVTSFHYLTFTAYHEAHKHRDPHTTAARLLKYKIPVTWVWAMRHSVEMILSYSICTSRDRIGRDLFGFKKYNLMKHYHLLLPPWIVERALYEISYELSYRPHWFVIPVLGIIHSPIPYMI